jgi:SAM-dependent methyltransferase
MNSLSGSCDSADKSITELDYVSFISLLNETNRPPGGKDTVRYWIQNAFISHSSNVLEIGSNTGFTSLELARSCGCQVLGIDISGPAVDVARRELAADVAAIRSKVRFQVADAHAIPAASAVFDAVICGGALSFVSEKSEALVEICRVLRPWGFLCASPLYFRKPPPERLLDDLADLLGFRISVYTADDWMALFRQAGLEIYIADEMAMSSRTESEVASYVEEIVGALDGVNDSDCLAQIRGRALRTYLVFNENHGYLGVVRAVLRLRAVPEQRELFTVGDRRW